MNGLEHAHAARVDAPRRRQTHASDQPRAQIAQDVAEHVVGDDDAEILRLEQEVLAQGVDEVVLPFHVGEFLRRLPEYALPQAVRVDDGAVLVRHGHLGVAVFARVLEGVAADARDALVRVDVLLDGDLIRRPLLEVAAHAHVQPFGVLAHDDEVDFGVPLQGRKIRMEQRRRP